MDATQGVTIGATVVIAGLGLVALLGGLWMFLHALNLGKRCTEETGGTITDILDDGFASWGKKKPRKPAEEEKVVAANEAIAAKKRSYLAKKRRQAELEAQAAASTWRPVVSYAVGGQTFEKRAVRGVNQSRFKVGQPCAVHYDPAKPTRCWLSIDGLPRTFGLILMACGAVLIALGIGCLFFLPALADLSNQTFSM